MKYSASIEELKEIIARKDQEILDIKNEVNKILSIAINLPAEEKDKYMKEQRKIIQQDLAISTDEEKIIELESHTKAI